jgi:hypothetical protein
MKMAHFLQNELGYTLNEDLARGGGGPGKTQAHIYFESSGPAIPTRQGNFRHSAPADPGKVRREISAGSGWAGGSDFLPGTLFEKPEFGIIVIGLREPAGRLLVAPGGDLPCPRNGCFC